MTPEEFRRAGHEAVELIAGYLDALPGQRVFRPVPAESARAFAAEPGPVHGQPVAAVLAEFSRSIAPYPFGNGHPRFFGWVNPPPHPLGVIAEALAAAMNPSVAGGNHAAVHIEHQVVRWFVELVGWPGEAAGMLVSGGSAATLTALAAARHRATARAGVDLRQVGLQAVDGPVVLYVGEETHACARKAAEVLGIGSAGIRVIGSDGAHRMRPDQLRRELAADRRAGAVQVAVVASVGTVNTGAVDPVDEIAAICAEFGVWLHLDAAYGGPAALLLDEYRSIRTAMAGADSIALDPHKWLYAPVDVGLVLLREPQAARDCFSLVPPYLRTDGDQGGVTGPVWFSEYGIEQTRPFRALKVWMLLKHLGAEGYRALIGHDLAMARHLAAGVRAAPDLELLAEGLSIVCFRVRPAGWSASAAELDGHNRDVLTAVQLGGRAFASATTVDGVAALRACVVNPGTGAADVDALLDEVRAVSTALHRRGG